VVVVVASVVVSVVVSAAVVVVVVSETFDPLSIPSELPFPKESLEYISHFPALYSL
jgi:hypothetical protein